MKKIICLVLLGMICSCKVGEFPEKRNKLHEMGYEQDYCEKHPDRCVDGVAW